MDISELEGINSEEVGKLCGANIKTVETFMAQLKTGFVKGIKSISKSTGIRPERLLEFVPPDRLPVGMLSEKWLEGVTKRVLREAKPDDWWLKRCRHGFRRFKRGLKGHWLGWRKNLPMLVVVAGLLMVIVLAARALGWLHWLPSPLGIHSLALIATTDMEKDRVLKSEDLYPSFILLQNDYFKPEDKLEGLVLARRVTGQKPLRFRDVLRLQVIATTDILPDEIIREEQIKLDWRPYQPGAALTLEEVSGRKASQALRKDGIILTDCVKPAK